ncbi:hypothetical protein [Kangiella taiwanensis]|uniref:PilZ domain-containing protein n=1 Tax=Kangiella taiwanensis TaxID=1079179 RepID=A0ABP8I076_9GAMM|nr:hypothetical protein [Kangiella taiwanensis]
MDSIQLTYPSTQHGQEFMMDHKPSAVKRWLSDLTFTDINKSLDHLLQAIRTLNRTEQKVSQREENLATLEQGYLQMSRHFRQHNDQRQVIASDHQAKLLSSFTAEMAYGHKRVIHELAEQRVALKKQGRLAYAINQAQHYLGLHLIEHYQQYSPIPSYIWHELHKLYHFAEHEKLHRLKVNNNQDALLALDTVENTYKRNCLMSVINPYHVEGNQHWHLFKYFSHWSQLTMLSNDLKKFAKSECFVIDLTSGKRPEYAATDNEYEEHPFYRLLITSPLLEKLNQQLRYFSEHNSLPNPGFYPAIEPSIGQKLLQQIYAYCDHHIARKDARYPVISDVNLVWSLSNIVKVLQSDKQPSETSEELEACLTDMLGAQYPHLLQWQAVNYSNGGICVRQPKEDITQLNVGNLVLLKRHINQQPQKTWQLGIVRWLNGNKSTGASMGVEYLHGQKLPAHYLTKNNHGEVLKHNVLLVTPFDHQEPLLIAPRHLIGNHKTLNLELNGKPVEHQIISTKESNSLITIFEVTTL